jgi:ferredoxin
MARILSIRIDENTCTCSQACVAACPEVLDGDTENYIPRVREDAALYFESHVEQIRMAADVCPVEAVLLEIEED